MPLLFSLIISFLFENVEFWRAMGPPHCRIFYSLYVK